MQVNNIQGFEHNSALAVEQELMQHLERVARSQHPRAKIEFATQDAFKDDATQKVGTADMHLAA